jgi:hypothetical protein
MSARIAAITCFVLALSLTPSRGGEAAEPPDRSTPEKTATAFLDVTIAALRDRAEFDRLTEEEAVALGDALASAKYREAARAKREAERAQGGTVTVTAAAPIEVSGKTVEETRCTLTGTRSLTCSRKAPGRDAPEELTVPFPFGFVLEKSGEAWLVVEFRMVCWNCQGSKECPDCGGLGEDAEGPCATCNGTRQCATCDGRGVAAKEISHELLLPGMPPLLAPETPFAPSTGQATVEEAARALLSAETAGQYLTTARTLAWLSPRMEALAALLAPEPAAALAEKLASAVETGKRMAAGETSSVEDAFVEDGRGFARVVRATDTSATSRWLRLAQVDGGWQVETELRNPCPGCGESGRCGACEGRGGEESAPCPKCRGSGRCRTCAGTGRVE